MLLPHLRRKKDETDILTFISTFVKESNTTEI